MDLKRLTVRARLNMAFGTLSVLVLLVTIMSLLSLNDANKRFSGYVNGINMRLALVMRVRTAVDRQAIAARDLMLVTQQSDADIAKATITESGMQVQARLKELKDATAQATDTTPRARELVANIDQVEIQYAPVSLAIVNAALNQERIKAVTLMNEQSRPLLAKLIQATNAYADYTHDRAKAIEQQAAAHYVWQRAISIGICLVSLAVAVIAGALITRSLTRALGAEPGAICDITQSVAGGDLSPVTGAQFAPTGSVLASIGEMQASLVRLIGQVRTAADSIATGSSQIASGNQDLSLRTEQQAASLQETASSMEQLTSTVRQNAESAQQASVLAVNASDVAQRGSMVVGQVVDTMTDISASSSKIADITGIIEGIAFQTNILALNAAVEAARAGEQGRGFAVVASEVRSLAQRSSSAAKEIKDLIVSSVQKVRAGAALVGEAGTTMTEVTKAVARVTDIMGQIASASSEQSRGIEQVNLAITQMDDVTQQNAALVEEAAAASKSLELQGQKLNESVAFFRMNE